MEKPNKEEPQLISVTMFKVPGDDFCWRAVKTVTQGKKVLSQEDICKPDIRAIIEERFKIFVARNIFGRL